MQLCLCNSLLLAACTQRYKRAGKSIYYFSLVFHQLSIQKSNSVVELHHNDYSGTTILSKLEISYLQCLLFCLGKILNFRTTAYIWSWDCQGIILEFKWIFGLLENTFYIQATNLRMSQLFHHTNHTPNFLTHDKVHFYCVNKLSKDTVTGGFGANSALCHHSWISPVMLTGLVMLSWWSPPWLPLAANLGFSSFRSIGPGGFWCQGRQHSLAHTASLFPEETQQGPAQTPGWRLSVPVTTTQSPSAKLVTLCPNPAWLHKPCHHFCKAISETHSSDTSKTSPNFQQKCPDLTHFFFCWWLPN